MKVKQTELCEQYIEYWKQELDISIPVKLAKFDNVILEADEAESEEKGGKLIIYLRSNRQKDWEKDIIHELLHYKYREWEMILSDLIHRYNMGQVIWNCYELFLDLQVDALALHSKSNNIENATALHNRKGCG